MKKGKGGGGYQLIEKIGYNDDAGMVVFGYGFDDDEPGVSDTF